MSDNKIPGYVPLLLFIQFCKKEGINEIQLITPYTEDIGKKEVDYFEKKQYKNK